MTACPKPVKRSTVKARKKRAKTANIKTVRQSVEKRDGETCRISAALKAFGFFHKTIWSKLELAHLAGRGMGGNPDLSRDTAENTVLAWIALHQGPRSLHSGHLKIRALTDQGTNGPCCFEFYEKLPTDI